MKDEYKTLVQELEDYKQVFDTLSEEAHATGDLREARKSAECAIRVLNTVTALKASMDAFTKQEDELDALLNTLGAKPPKDEGNLS